MKRFLFLFFLVFFGFFVHAQDLNVSSDVSNYLKRIVESMGVEEGSIGDIFSVDKSRLPSAIDINRINENQIEIYGIKYYEENINKSLYVVSFSTFSFPEISEEVERYYDYLVFSGDSAGFLNEYIFVDDGSIIGISSSVKYSGEGDIDVEVYKNGISTGFMNEISSDGNHYDFDLQSDNMNFFKKGDRISVKVVSYGGINIKEVNSVVKVKT
jgi:hypothetical protein